MRRRGRRRRRKERWRNRRTRVGLRTDQGEGVKRGKNEGLRVG